MHLRRDFIKLLASLPVLGMGCTQPKPKFQSEARTFPVPEIKHIGNEPTWQELGRQLRVNLLEYVAYDQETTQLEWDPDELNALLMTSHYFAKNLRNKSLSEGFVPEAEDAVDKVLFDVMDAPIQAFYDPTTSMVVVGEAQARKVKALIRTEDMCLKDLFQCTGDTLEKVTECAGKQAARDIQIEIKYSALAGKPIKLFALYLPPFMKPINPEVAKNWSVCRTGLIVRYAKIL